MSEQAPSGRPGSEAAENVAMRVSALAYPTDAPLYANHVQASIAPHDVTLHFGWYSTPVLSEPPKEPVDVPVLPVASISIPLGMLRPIVKLLEAQADGWEDNFKQRLPDPELSTTREDRS